MKQFILGLIALAMTAQLAFAHGEGEGHQPEPNDPEEQARIQQCLQVGAQQSWGAYARYEGAPLVLKYVELEVLKKMFMEDRIPNDGIYFAKDQDPTDSRLREQRATYGWKKADLWIAQGQTENPGRTYLTAFFYDQCKNKH